MTKYDRTGLGASGDFSRGNLADELREKDEIIESLERSIGVMGQIQLNHTLRNQELEEENEAYKKRIDGRDITAGNQADYIAKLQAEAEKLRRDNDAQAKTIDKLTERLGYDVDSPYIEAEAKELEDLEDELELINGTLDWWRKQCIRLANEKVNLHQIVKNRDAEIEELNEARAEAAEAYIQSKTSLEERIALLTAEKDVSLENHTDIVNELREDLEVMTLHRNNLQKERLEHIREIEVLKQTKAGSNAINTIDGLTADLRDKNKKIVELKERIDTLIEERAELAKSQIAKVDELRNRIDELEELNHGLIKKEQDFNDWMADGGYIKDE